MKLDSVNPKVIRTGDFENVQFGVGDLSVLLDILRSKMYSNAIKAICQEIMSNARDAHREFGKQNVPIEVKIPNDLDPTFHVRDFGPGITPERMADVFVKYGASTKRDDNEQTGGFGLGAKTPFAYTDAFSITSITPEDIFITKDGERFEDVMVKREYIAFIDETRVGSMSLVSSVVTTEEQGTKITITIPTDQKQDYRAFREWVHHVAMYWETVPGEKLPTIVGYPEWEWKIPNREEEGENWFFEGSKAYYRKDLSVIIDGIQYPINVHNLALGYDSPEATLLNYSICLMFEVGEISITANREEIDYAKRSTVNIIKSRLRLVIADLQDRLSKKVENAGSLWDAKCLWRTYSSEFSGIVKTVFWNGIEIDNSPIANRKYYCNTCRFEKKHDGTIRRREVGAIEFLKNAVLCIEDTGLKHPSKCRIQTLFDQDDDLQYVYALKYSEQDGLRDQSIKDLEKDYHFSKLKATLLSTVEKSVVKRASGGPTGKMTRIYSFNSAAYRRSQYWGATDLDLEEDSGIYVELKNRKSIVNGFELHESCFLKIVDALALKDVYGIPTRYLKKVGDDWEKLENVVADKIIKLEKDPAVQTYVGEPLSECIKSVFNHINTKMTDKKLETGIKDSNSLFLKYIKSSQDIETVRTKLSVISSLRNGMKNINNSQVVESLDSKIGKLKDKVKKQYPMIFMADSWIGASGKLSQFIEYINLIDATQTGLAPASAVKPKQDNN